MAEQSSIGSDVLIGVFTTLHDYFLETYVAFADSFYPVAVVLVTLYVVVMGILAMRGKVGDSALGVAVMILSVPVCFGIFFHIDVFKAWIYEPIISTMLGMMGLALGNDNFSFAAMYAPIDTAFSSIFVEVDKITNQMDTWDVGLKVKVFVVSGLLGGIYGALYIIFSVLIISAIFGLHVLIVLAPIFGTFAAFKPTRGFFFAWLKSIITYALIPVFTAIVMGITLHFLEAAIADIAAINVVEDGVFTGAVAGALFIGIMSITLHIKAPEFASAITGGQVSGLGGFFGTVGAAAYGANALYQKAGGGAVNAKMGGMAMAGGKNILDNGLIGAGKNLYSQMRGFGK